MGTKRQYNKQALTSYFDSVNYIFDSFKGKIKKVDSSLKAYVDSNTWAGVSAEAAKVMTQEAEPALIQNICYLQNEMSELQNDLLEMFYYDVDRNTFANLETDVLETIQNELTDFRTAYEGTASEIEKIAESLQNYSRYGTFSIPDFTATRVAYSDKKNC